MKPLVALGALLVPWAAAASQHAPLRLRVDAQAVAALTAVTPTPRNQGTATELRLIHPLLMFRGETGDGRARLVATGNFEGATIPQGTLAFGAWGEGYVDRRHPHTYLHELMLVLSRRVGHVEGVLAGGKGFVPFGTDDPMTRPPLRYPVNHHLSQILERAVLLGAVGTASLLVEGALFNGDEPEGPGSRPNLERFGDSWSVRVTARPGAGLELSGSHAEVRSPEHRPGAGPREYKWNAAARWRGTVGGARGYALAEWARTARAGGTVALGTALLEAALTTDSHQPYVRVERTERPEEERVADYRTVRPPRDDALLGITRWTIVTAGYRVTALALGSFRVHPFVEASLGRATRVSGGFDPAAHYGGAVLRSVTAGLRLSRGLEHHRMGRYADPAQGAGHH